VLPVDTFSIGFDADGFDEMEYARCAAERYGSRSHEYYLKPADIVTAIPSSRANTTSRSATPRRCRPGSAPGPRAKRVLQNMFAGDGGDEIFGGNARYAKQGLFEAYARLPAALRRGLIEPIAAAGLSTGSRCPS
jgi:asparagine synthase (glutamine-hydrolysing)